MPKFLAVFTGSESSANQKKWEALDEKARGEREQAGMTAWMTWAKKNEAAIVEMGAPLGDTKQINREGISNITNNLAAYTVVEAASHEAAAELFLNHPHFMIFPGDGVELMECLPIPGM